MRIRGLSLALVVWAMPLLAQPQIDLFRLYDAGSTQESFDDIYPRRGGGYYLVGETGQRLWLMRLNREGEVVWNRPRETGEFFSVIEADNRDVVAGGRIGTEFTAGRFSPENCDSLWMRDYGHQGSCRAVIELKDGGLVLVGYARSGNGYLGCIIRANDDGDPIWEQTYGQLQGMFDGFFLYTARETDDGIIAAGAFWPHNAKRSGWIIKISFNGELQWSQIVDAEFDRYFASMVSCPNGFALAGNRVVREDGGQNSRPEKYCLTFINADGQILWEHIYALDNGIYYTANGLDKLADGGFCIVGSQEVHSGQIITIPLAIRVNGNGDLLWRNDFTVQHEGQQLTVYGNSLNSVICENGNQLVACGSFESRDGNQDMDGLVTRFDPDLPNPILFYRSPADSFLTVLQGDPIDFMVRARSREGNNFDYRWLRDEDTLGGGMNDTALTVTFPEAGVDTVGCRVTIQDYTTATGWIVNVSDLFIAAYTPDTLNLAIHRGAAVRFSIDSVAATQGDPLNYAWTLTDLGTQQQLDEGADTTTSIGFHRSGNYSLEGYVFRGESSDAVTWNIAVRSTVLDFRPEQRDLTVPLDTLITFGIIPFNPADASLRYSWLLDGDSAGKDSSLRVQFRAVAGGQAGRLPYAVEAILSDSSDADTIVWNITVVRREGVKADWKSAPPGALALSLSPNPFNARTTVRFSVPEAGLARVKVYDLTGKMVATLFEGRVEGGQNVRPTATFDATNLPAGLYFLRLEAAGKVKIAKAVVIK